MNKRGKSWHLIVTALLIVVFSFTALFGVSYTYGDTKNVYIKGAEDIRFGIDIRGGVDVTFMPADGVEATDDQMTAAKTVIEDRLVGLGITDYEDYVDYNKDRIIVRFPWKTGETDFNPQTAIDEIGTTAEMVFRKGSTADGEEILSGDDVTSATAGYNQENGYVVQLQFSADGAKKFAEATTELAAQSNGTISIWLDGENISTATVKTAITDGNAVIEGSFTQDQVTALANQINSGSLPFALSAESFSTISPTLGAKSLDVMVLAGIIAFAFVALLMIVRYRLPGTIAVISLFGQVVATLAFVSGYFTVFNGSTLTLPGIAGIILSIGMAVDANVIIFTRIKEEIGLGKTVHSAIKTGFAKALSAIVDGNVTTLIAAAVLYWRGSGTVKGFATTLALGIVLSMFTALFVTKFTLNTLYNLGFQDQKFYGIRKEKKALNFLGKRNICFIISAVMILAGVAGMVMNKSSIGNAFNYSLDFQGGTSTSVTFNEDMSLDRISSEVVPVVESITNSADTQTQKVAGTNEVIIKTRTLSVEERQALDEALVENFGVDESKITAESISGAVSAEMKRDAVMATAIATVFMLLYIWVRFKDIRFAASAVLALVHDVLVVVACYALAKWSVGSTAIACLLTIVGYSINATIVIFDRIRENMKLLGNKESAETIVNTSISQTLTRSINTTLTTFVMVLILYILGVSSIREFALPLMVGLICGTYSSVCLSGSVWYVLNKKRMEKNAKPAGKKAKAEK